MKPVFSFRSITLFQSKPTLFHQTHTHTMFVASLNLDLFFKKVFSDKRIAKKYLEDVLGVRISEITLLSVEHKISDDSVVVKFDFFSQNRIIYLFQKNIVRNKKNAAYFKWFDFAEKSKNVNNEESDFINLKNDKVMVEVIKRLKKDELSPDEHSYLLNLPDYEGAFAVQVELKSREKDKEWTAKLERKTKQFQKAERLLKQEQDAKIRLERKLQAEQAKLQAEQAKTLKAVKAFLALGKDIATIAGILDLSIEETTVLVTKIQEDIIQN